MPSQQIKSGIYIIRNLANDNVYIGSAVNLKLRMRGHKESLKRGDHENSHLQRAWKKYGEDNFKFSVLLRCDKKNLIHYEQRMIDLYKNRKGSINLYNICLIAGSCLGKKHTLEARKRMSEALKGTRPSLQCMEAARTANKNRVGLMRKKQIRNRNNGQLDLALNKV